MGRVRSRNCQPRQAASATPAIRRARAAAGVRAHDSHFRAGGATGLNAAAPASRSDAGRMTGMKRRAAQKCSGQMRAL